VRTLKSIANSSKALGLTIAQLEITAKYDERQLDLLYKHDIEYDVSIPDYQKQHMKEAYMRIFKEAKNPVVQFLVTGAYAISKV
jgi:hypothetical protein